MNARILYWRKGSSGTNTYVWVSGDGEEAEVQEVIVFREVLCT